jgi:hypothetical protein
MLGCRIHRRIAAAGSRAQLHRHYGRRCGTRFDQLKRWREWLLFFIVASVIAGPQMLWSTHGSAVHTRAFIAWEFGWGHGEEALSGFG